MHRGSTEQQVLINAAAETYPLQIGKDAGSGRRAFNVSWDGGIYGGTTNEWSISPAGVVNFSKGTLSSISAYSMYASNIQLSGGITYSGANYTPETVEFTAMAAPASMPRVATSVGGGYLYSGTTWWPVKATTDKEADTIGWVAISLENPTVTGSVSFGTTTLKGNFFCNGVKQTATNMYYFGGSGGSSPPINPGGGLNNKPSFDYFG